MDIASIYDNNSRNMVDINQYMLFNRNRLERNLNFTVICILDVGDPILGREGRESTRHRRE